MQIVIEVLIGWKNGKGHNGIFGVPIAYGESIEEQARFSLHSHICVWIKGFNEIRDLMFDKDHVLRNDARKEMLRYYKLIGQASLGDLDIYIPDKYINDVENDTHNHLFDESRCDPNIIFEATQPDMQTIRNMRHH